MDLKVKRTIKSSVFALIMIVGILCCGFKSAAAANDIYSFITQFTLNGETWTYGDEPKVFTVYSNESVSMEYILYFTNSEWRENYQSLNWDLPEGIQIMHVNENITTTINGQEVTIGTMTIVDSEVRISIFEEYEQIMASSDNIEICAEVVLEFTEGTHNLGDIITIEAIEKGPADASWGGYSVKVNKIDETEVSKLLGGALFEITQYEYSEEDHEYKEGARFDFAENYVEENGTFINEGTGFRTIEDVAALLEGGFEPGEFYLLTEMHPPIGYLPTAEAVKFAFYHYTESSNQGTLKKIQELNKAHKERYEAEGGVAVFGEETGVLGSGDYNIYVKESKTPGFQVLKLDAMTGDELADVVFTLRIDADKAGYSVEQYLGLENAGWTYNESTGMLEWEQQTNDQGRIVYPQGTVPYVLAE